MEQKKKKRGIVVFADNYCLCDSVKNLEIGRFSWIIWLGSKCNHMYLLQKEAEFSFHTDRGDGGRD